MEYCLSSMMPETLTFDSVKWFMLRYVYPFWPLSLNYFKSSSQFRSSNKDRHKYHLPINDPLWPWLLTLGNAKIPDMLSTHHSHFQEIISKSTEQLLAGQKVGKKYGWKHSKVQTVVSHYALCHIMVGTYKHRSEKNLL